MGLFDKRDKKKKSDDFDSPVEKIDLSAPDEPVEMTAEEPPATAPAAAATAAAAAPAREPDPEPEDDYEYDSSFGIDKAIELMRTLPQDNIELVVQVVKLTLESTKVKIGGIIQDATRKQDDIQGRIKVLKAEIADFEKEIAQRKEEITGLEADYEETTTVKQRLELAEKITKRDAAKASAAKASAAKKVSSDGKDQANASGSIGGSSSGSSSSGGAGSSSSGGSGTRPSVGGLGKQSVVIKK